MNSSSAARFINTGQIEQQQTRRKLLRLSLFIECKNDAHYITTRTPWRGLRRHPFEGTAQLHSVIDCVTLFSTTACAAHSNSFTVLDNCFYVHSIYATWNGKIKHLRSRSLTLRTNSCLWHIILLFKVMTNELCMSFTLKWCWRRFKVFAPFGRSFIHSLSLSLPQCAFLGRLVVVRV